MIDCKQPLSISRQAKAVGISRGSVYYLPRPVSDFDLYLMRRIDQLHLEYAFAGSCMLRDLLRQLEKTLILMGDWRSITDPLTLRKNRHWY